MPARTWIAIGVAFAGIVVMFADSLDAGRLAGNLLALGVSCCFAGQVTVLRKYHARVDMLPQVLIAGVVSLVVALALVAAVRGHRSRPRDPRADGLRAARHRLPARHRRVARTLSATELGLLALLEPILGPLWVWALMGERPGDAALTGGAIVLAAVIANEAFAAWRRAAPRGNRCAADAAGPTLTPGP